MLATITSNSVCAKDDPTLWLEDARATHLAALGKDPISHIVEALLDLRLRLRQDGEPVRDGVPLCAL